jgi:hypothetical protein
MINYPKPKSSNSYSMAMMCSMDAMQRAWERAAIPMEGIC